MFDAPQRGTAALWRLSNGSIFPQGTNTLNFHTGIDPLYTAGGVQKANWAGLLQSLCHVSRDTGSRLNDFVALNQFVERTCFALEVPGAGSNAAMPASARDYRPEADPDVRPQTD
ncbi:unnamed protein product [Fusarium venenatum]|uniref:Uncharacterized protein n=1 Tax=Fusarium venenatum TaxID=56646 RepID=A0A2L2SWT5_9HYPO|nr:uncharacterized protein FVRRES_05644 [Fusarium venenatum]CEI61208.1 unnamed protein product [Fusarium venenatum]